MMNKKSLSCSDITIHLSAKSKEQIHILRRGGGEEYKITKSWQVSWIEWETLQELCIKYFTL
jgi:hypothetical protein